MWLFKSKIKLHFLHKKWTRHKSLKIQTNQQPLIKKLPVAFLRKDPSKIWHKYNVLKGSLSGEFLNGRRRGADKDVQCYKRGWIFLCCTRCVILQERVGSKVSAEVSEECWREGQWNGPGSGKEGLRASGDGFYSGGKKGLKVACNNKLHISRFTDRIQRNFCVRSKGLNAIYAH